ncbi:MAG: OmpA family protein [Candidatus Kapabacteria bacterium]|nr:OmpA family protein [Candidatus Kapabacteria bacterium]
MSQFILQFVAMIGLAIVIASPLSAQSKQLDVIGTVTCGINKYHGELADDSFGASGAISLQFAALDRLWVEGRIGLGEYRWKVTDAKIGRYPDYFGAGAKIGDKYPGSLTTIESDNESRVTTFDFLVSYVLVDNIPAVPFITAGVGLVNFAPSNSGEHSALPNNEAGKYPKSVVSIPLGGGLRIPFSRSVGLLLRAEYRLVFSEYLDDVKYDGGNDALTNVSIGLTYRFNNPRPSPKPSHHTNACPVCGCGEPGRCCCDTPPPPPPAPAPAPAPAPPPPPADTVRVQTPAPPPDTVRIKEPAVEPVVAPPSKKRTSFAKDIRFKVNTDEFDFEQPETAKNLNELLTYMQESCDELQVMVEGHASADGPAQRNKDLSELRAQKVRQWLLEQGVPQKKIRGAVGYGSAMPRVKEPTSGQVKKMSKEQLEAIRRQNRRIEVAVLRECAV